MFLVQKEYSDINGSEICFKNNECSHWSKQDNTIDYGSYNVTYNPLKFGDFINQTQYVLRAFGYTSIVCCAITVLSYFIWKPLHCYSRLLVVIYAAVSLYLDIVIMFITERGILRDPEECQLDENSCRLMGLCLNLGYTSLLSYTIVIFAQILHMARNPRHSDPSMELQIVTHVVVWGLSFIQAAFPYFFRVIGYIGRPWNECGYCFWDDGSVDYYTDKLYRQPGPVPQDTIPLKPVVWLWMSGSLFALVSVLLLIIIFFAIGCAIKNRLRDETVMTSHKIDLVLIAEIRSKKLLMIVAISSIVAVSMLFRTVWTLKGADIYKDSPHCKFSWSTIMCFPEKEDLMEPADEIEVLFNRDTTIFMFSEAVVTLSAGILNFLLFCFFSSAFRTCLYLWLRNMKYKKFILTVDDMDFEISNRGKVQNYSEFPSESTDFDPYSSLE